MARRNTVEVVIKADDKASRNITSISDKLGKLGTLAAVGIGAAVAATAVFAVSSVKAFATFERQMNEVFTLLPDLSQQAMDDITKQVKDLSLEFGVMTDEVVPALYQAISAGVPPDNVFEFMEIATKASIGGITTLETAVDGITSVVNAYGSELVSATQASDLLFTAVRLGKTDFDQLSRFMFQVIPTAASLGVEFGNVTAAMATITAQGVPTRVAATQLRSLLEELSKAGSETADIFTEMAGKSFKDFIAEGNNLQDALKLMERAAKESGLELSDMFTSIQAGGAALGLTGTAAQAFTDSLAAMEDSAGATQAAFDQMNQGILPAVERLQAAFNVLRINFGSVIAPLVVPVIDKVREAIAGIARAFDDADGPLRKFFDRIVAGVTAIQAGADPLAIFVTAINNLFDAADVPFPLPIKLIGEFRNILKDITSFIGDLVGQFISWKDVLIVLGGILGVVIVNAILGVVVALAPIAILLGAMVLAVGLLRTAWDKDFGGIRTKTQEIIDFFKTDFLPAIGFDEGGVGEVLTRAGAAARDVGGIIAGALAIGFRRAGKAAQELIKIGLLVLIEKLNEAAIAAQMLLDIGLLILVDTLDRASESAQQLVTIGLVVLLDTLRDLLQPLADFVAENAELIVILGAVAITMLAVSVAATIARTATALYALAQLALAGATALATGGFTALLLAIIGVIGIMLPAMIIAGLLVAAYLTNFGGFADFIDNRVRPALEKLFEVISRIVAGIKAITGGVAGIVQDPLGTAQVVAGQPGALEALLTAIVVNSPFGFLGNTGSIFPGSQGGGQVRRGQPALVGEQGPELFIPDSDGSIQPGDRFGGIGRGTSIVINFLGNGGPRDMSEADRMGAAIVNALRARGMTL